MSDADSPDASQDRGGEVGIPTVEHLIEVALFAPLGLAAKVIEEAPGAIERTRRQLVLARFIGKMAVGQATKELHRRIDEVSGAAERSSPPTGSDDRTARAGDEDRAASPLGLDSTRELVNSIDSAGGGADDADLSARSTESRSSADHADDRTTGDATSVPSVDDLALPGYDHLPSAHVVRKLAGLSVADRAQIRRYEHAHRQRRTVLGRLDQLEQAGD